MGKASGEAITILVTPVWNDASRLAVFGRELAKELASRASMVEWIIADDGSGPEQGEQLDVLRREFAAIYPRVRVHLAAEHHGKGSVVREAWALEPTADWYAFIDSDGSVSAGEMLDLIDLGRASGRSTLAVRENTESTTIEEDFWRGLRHQGFLMACRLIVGVKSNDTQCGAKLLLGSDYRVVVDRLSEPGLAFDAELLAELSAAGFDWDEVPVNWSRKGGSRVKPWRDAVDMLAALFRIRAKLNER